MRSSLYFSNAAGYRYGKTVNEPVSWVEGVRIYLTILSGVTFLMLTYHYWLSSALFP